MHYRSLAASVEGDRSRDAVARSVIDDAQN